MKKHQIWIWLLYAVLFLALPFTAFVHGQTNPINNLVLQNSGTNVTGIVKANGSSAASAAAAGTDYAAATTANSSQLLAGNSAGVLPTSPWAPTWLSRAPP